MAISVQEAETKAPTVAEQVKEAHQKVRQAIAAHESGHHRLVALLLDNICKHLEFARLLPHWGPGMTMEEAAYMAAHPEEGRDGTADE